MKLHLLRIEGMGPFAKPVSIDFSRFDASGIFLLEGPTGSGKSSIIDAVTFALYGDVARLADASKDRLRSSYCAPNDPSRVECVFEVSSGIYRVTRTPRYIKPGRESKVNATVQLERVVEDTEGAFQGVETLSRSHAEADAEITALVGLKKEQFLQTVVLPQGKFATFLTARSETRREILQDVFGTHIYRDLQERFRLAAIEHAKAVEAAQAAVAEARARILELSTDLLSLEESTPSPDSYSGVDQEPEQGDEALLTRLSEVLDNQGQAINLQVAQAREDLETARRDEQSARQGALNLAARDALVKRLEELEGQGEEIAAARLELAEARDAETARPFLDDFDSAYEALTSACDKTETALDNLASGASAELPLPETVLTLLEHWGQPASKSAQGWEALSSPDSLALLRAHAIDAERQRARLSELLTLEKGLAQREGDLAELSQREAATATALAEAEALGAQLPAQLDQAQSAYEQARRACETLPALEEELTQLRQRHAHAKNVERYEAQIPGAQQDVDDAGHVAQKADARARSLRAAWMADAASALACELQDDEPCPVCGSPTHPSPATPQGEGETVSHAQVEEADAARQAADRAFQERRDVLAELTAQCQRERLAAGGSLDELRPLEEAALEALQTAQKAESSLPLLSAEIEQVRAAQERVHTQIITLREEGAALGQQRELHAANVEADRRRCDDAAGAFSTLSAHDAALSARIDAVEQAATALNEWIGAEKAFEAAASRVSRALEINIPVRDYVVRLRSADSPASAAPVQHFDQAQSFEQAQVAISTRREHLRSLAECHALEGRIESYHSALSSTRESLSNPDFATLTGEEAAALAACQARLVAAEDTHTQMVTRQAHATAQAEALRRAINKFREASTACDAAVKAAEPARRLHALASATTAENLTRTPLAAWVLMARFEEVLAAANPRLLAISQGRYELIRVDDDGSQSRKSGLGVAVVDHDTETTRLPSTLSGGETFYVSLSLALGLADVVTGENGGVELRTMFIDEGFGSLDANTLETVMAQLQRLRDSGRTVGVISHVHEMATLIPDQIRVRWNAKEGSTVTVRA